MLLFRYLSSIAQGTRMSYIFRISLAAPNSSFLRYPKCLLARMLQIGKKYLFGDLGAELLDIAFFLVTDTHLSICPCLWGGLLFLSLGTLKMTVLCHSISKKWF